MLRTTLVGTVLLLGLGALAWLVLREPEPSEARAELDVVAELSARDTAGFERALEPRELVFPADHGPHAGFRTEWWYFTGNLESGAGRRFGYQLTFFRTALSQQSPARESAWGSNQVWMAHFALTDVEAGSFSSFEAFSREALGLAGARAEPFRVWLKDWEVEGLEVMRLRAGRGDVEIRLELQSEKPPAAHGERGLSRKGKEAASFYYSLTRLSARGTVRTGAGEVEVKGTSWMDREWSTSALESGQVGWDWFGLQLEEGVDAMAFRVRGEGGVSAGSWIGRGGEVEGLEKVEIEELGKWRSDATGVEYPSGWRLQVKGRVLEVRPVLEGQEIAGSARYWEGAVDVVERGERVGWGYVELVGY